jgi:hypothetical protein
MLNDIFLKIGGFHMQKVTLNNGVEVAQVITLVDTKRSRGDSKVCS